jgi:eukaryotic-like serine/threonine-protein kinase
LKQENSAHTIFNDALELSDLVARETFVREACAGDAALRIRVDKLLQAHEEAGGFFSQPLNSRRATAATSPLTALSIAKAGDIIGRYKLLEQIGEGGCGVVYMAEQTEPVRRRVALKVIKLGMDTRQVVGRFEAERQALAMMEHPNIARVLDAGSTESGRPYFVMELVRGVKITEFCDRQKLSTEERLELFIRVCHAVQHAHQKGIIHRDLKPSNILVTIVDGVPVPKVIDFGIAKATSNQPLTDKTLFTAFQQFIGTPAYMSPEQTEMSGVDIDTRADLYSLGVLLYELLTGRTPFDQHELLAAGLDGMRRIIREQEPARPSTRLSAMAADALTTTAQHRHVEPPRLVYLVRGELDWIVMKALEKDRARRYETANSLATDVQRFLADEPVLACPPSTGYRVRKLIRRNKASALAAAFIVLAILAGTLVSVWQAVRADRERRIAEANEQRAVAASEAERKAKQSAEAREAETMAVLDFVEKKILAAARPDGYPGGLGRDVTLRKALEIALADEALHDQPLIEARLRRTLSTTFANLGEAGIAAQHAEKARTIYSKHLGLDHPDTLSSMHNLAACYSALGRQVEALELREETLAGMKARLGFDDPKTLSAMNSLALSYAAVGRPAEALKLHQETLALLTTKLGSNHLQTLGSMNNLALAFSSVGRYDEALKLGQETLELTKARLGPEHPRTLACMDSLAAIYGASGRLTASVKLYDETVMLMKTRLGRDNTTTLSAMNALAGGLAALGRHAEAVGIYEETLALRESRLGPDHGDTVSSIDKLARLLATSRDLNVGNAKRAVELAKRAVAVSPHGDYWNTLGIAHYRASDHKAAVAALEKSMELRNGGDSFDWFFLAMAHWQLGDKEKAREQYDRAIAWMEQNDPKNESLIVFRNEAAGLLGKIR